MKNSKSSKSSLNKGSANRLGGSRGVRLAATWLNKSNSLSAGRTQNSRRDDSATLLVYLLGFYLAMYLHIHKISHS